MELAVRPFAVRPPVEDARGAVAEPGDHRARHHAAQRRAADAAGRARRLGVEAAVDGRRVPARARRPAARVRHARRPLRPQARPAGRRVDLRARQPRRARRRLGRRPDRGPRADGHRRSADHAGDAVDHRQRLQRARAWQGDRHLAALAAVGIGLGPLAGGLLLEWFDWSSVFMLNVPFAAVALPLGIRYVPESRDPHPGSFDPLGAVLSTVGFTALVFAIVEAPDEGWLSGLVLGALAVAVGLLAAFLWWELECDEPMLDLGFFRDAAFSVGTAAVSIAFFALMGGIFILTQYLQFAHGYSAIQAGAIM